MDCPRCGSINYNKDGFVKGRQRYACKACRYHYTVAKKSDVKSVETGRMALELYLNGLGFRATGRLLKISYGTVYAWIKKWGATVDLPKKEERVEFMELDEMHTYVGSKKTTVGYGLPLIDSEKGLSVLSAEIVPQKQDSNFGKK
jgi:transposase-like protein